MIQIKSVANYFSLNCWILANMFFAGCQAYSPRPVDFAREAESWLGAGELRFNSLADVAAVALVGNRELNQLRLKLAGAEAVAKASGWWEDPELGFDLMRIVNPSDNPFLGGVSLSFSIPLTGVPKLEREAAAFYSDAARAEIKAAELSVAADARMSAVKAVTARRITDAIRAFENDAEVRQATEALARLSALGEVSVTDLDSVRRRRHARLHTLRENESRADAADSELRRLLSASPVTRMDFAALAHAVCVHEELPPELPPLAYAEHWKVKAALARLDANERELKIQVMRQYPDLKIGPAYSHEDGNDRIGFTAGLTLPLWNRNRKAIAESESVRDAAAADAVAVWRELVEESFAARQRLKRWLDHPPESGGRRADEVGKLYRIGEITALEYVSAREEILEAELAEIEWHSGVCLAAEELGKNLPHHSSDLLCKRPSVGGYDFADDADILNPLNP